MEPKLNIKTLLLWPCVFWQVKPHFIAFYLCWLLVLHQATFDIVHPVIYRMFLALDSTLRHRLTHHNTLPTCGCRTTCCWCPQAMFRNGGSTLQSRPNLRKGLDTVFGTSLPFYKDRIEGILLWIMCLFCKACTAQTSSRVFWPNKSRFPVYCWK